MWSDSRLEDLLLILEERSKLGCGESVFAICAEDRELQELLQDDPLLREELERRFRRLRQVDQVIADDEFPPGELRELPGYDIQALIGRGGMGAVYRAHDQVLNRTVALKFLLAGRYGSKALLARFRAEAEAIARLSHPGVVQIFEFGQSEGLPFLVLEYVHGTNLKESLAGKPMQPAAAARLITQIARAVEHAHRAGIVHRDIKPSNVLIAADGEPKIMDFGLAKSLEGDWGLTFSGEAPGTPSYMAPEQVTGGTIGAATDVYALGAMLYECLTGRPPHLGATTAETLLQVSQHDPIAPSRLQPRLDRDLESVCLKCLEKESAARYASAGALADDLECWLSGGVTKARPAGPIKRLRKWGQRRPAVAGLVAVSVLAAVVIVGLAAEYMRHLRDSRATAQGLQTQAEASTLYAQQQLYAAEMRTALWAHESLNHKVLREFVSKYETSPLRGFEWHHLKQRITRGITRIDPQSPTEVDSVAFAPDGQEFATANRDGMIEIWSSKSGTSRASFRAHEVCANLVRYSPDGRLLATASCDATIRLWDPKSLELVREIRNPDGPVRAFRFGPSGEAIFSVGDDRPAVRMWDAATGALVREFEAEGFTFVCVAVSGDGKYVAAGGTDWIVAWQVETGEPVTRIHKPGGAFGLTFVSGDTEMLAYGAERDAIHVVSIPDGHARHSFITHGAANCLAVGDKPDRLYCATDAGVVDIWEYGPGIVASLSVHDVRITDIAVSPDRKRLLTSSFDRTAALTDVERPNPAEPFDLVALPEGRLRRAALNGQTSKLAMAYDDGRVFVCQVGDAGPPFELPRTANWIPAAVSFSLDGRFLNLQEESKQELWWTAGERPVPWSDEHPDVMAGTRSRDYVRLRPRADGLAVVDLRKGGTLFDIPAPPDTRFFGFIDGRRWIAVGSRSSLSLWDSRNQRELKTLSMPAGVAAVCLSSQQDKLAVAHGARTHLFAFPGGKRLQTFVGHEREVWSVTFSPDGKTLATGSLDGSVRLWNVATGQEMLRLRGHRRQVRALSFSSDGKSLWSLGTDSLDNTEIFAWATE